MPHLGVTCDSVSSPTMLDRGDPVETVIVHERSSRSRTHRCRRTSPRSRRRRSTGTISDGKCSSSSLTLPSQSNDRKTATTTTTTRSLDAAALSSPAQPSSADDTLNGLSMLKATTNSAGADHQTLGLSRETMVDEFFATLNILVDRADSLVVTEPSTKHMEGQTDDGSSSSESEIVPGSHISRRRGSATLKSPRESKTTLHFPKQLNLRSATTKLWLKPKSHVPIEDSLEILDYFNHRPVHVDSSSANHSPQVRRSMQSELSVMSAPSTVPESFVDENNTSEICHNASTTNIPSVAIKALSGGTKPADCRSPQSNHSCRSCDPTREPLPTLNQGRQDKICKNGGESRKNQSLSEYLNVHSPPKRGFDHNCTKDVIPNEAISVNKEDKISDCSEASTLISGRSAGSFYLSGVAIQNGGLIASRPNTCKDRSSISCYRIEEACLSPTTSTTSETSSCIKTTTHHQACNAEGVGVPPLVVANEPVLLAGGWLRERYLFHTIRRL